MGIVLQENMFKTTKHKKVVENLKISVIEEISGVIEFIY